MTGFDFFMYCLGLSTVLIAVSGSLVLFRTSKKRPPERVERPDPAGDGLVGRLLEAQQTRYAAPIVRRELPSHVGPRLHKRTVTGEPGPQSKG